jgi:hypothetical protein
MKKIFLIGDSIRFGAPPSSPGYGVYVKELLKDEAEVFAPNDNCRWVQYTFRYVHEWAANIPANEIDVVHWNNGLWDVLRLMGDEPFTEINDYGKMLVRVYDRIRSVFPNAKIVFATSTSVIEEWGNPDFMRYNKEINAYNEKAKEVLLPLGVKINDLYPLSCTLDAPYRTDWVHYNNEGSEILAKAVIKAINEA